MSQPEPQIEAQLPPNPVEPPQDAQASAEGSSGLVTLEKYACTNCSARRVKCNKTRPCSECTRFRFNCVYKVVEKVPRLRRKLPVEPRVRPVRPARVPPVIDTEVVSRKVGYRSPRKPKAKSVVESPAPQTNPPDPPVSTSTSFPFGSPAPTDSRLSLHPPVGHIFVLWHAFQENVNPVVRLIHAPTVQRAIMQATSDLQRVPPPTEALMFCVYLLAVVSMTASDCETRLGETRAALLSRYRLGTEQALARAGFLDTTDIVVLQAFVLYLLALRKVREPNSAWALSGMAVRIARHMGLHLEERTNRRPPYEAEMGRRLWWAMLILDARTGEYGDDVERSTVVEDFDINFPLNVNDSDLDPSMSEPPFELEGPTDMTFVLIRYEVLFALRCFYLRENKVRALKGRGWDLLCDPAIPVEDKKQLIDGLEKRLAQRYLIYCNPTVPLHLVMAAMGRIVILFMRFLAAGGSPHRGQRTTNLPLQIRHELFTRALEIAECIVTGYSNNEVKKWSWHMQSHFVWPAIEHLSCNLGDASSVMESGRARRALQSVCTDIFPEMSFLIADKSEVMKLVRQRLSMAASQPSTVDELQTWIGSQLPVSALFSDPSFLASLLSDQSSFSQSQPSIYPVQQEIPRILDASSLSQSRPSGTVWDGWSGLGPDGVL